MTRAAGKQERALSLKVAYLEGRADLVRQMAPHTITPPCTLRMRPLLPKTLVAAGAEEPPAAEGDTKLLSELSSAEINQVIRSCPLHLPISPYTSPNLPISPRISPHLPISPHISQVIRATLFDDMADALRCQGQDRLRVLAQGRTLIPTPTPAVTLTLAPALSLASDLTLTPTPNP